MRVMSTQLVRFFLTIALLGEFASPGFTQGVSKRQDVKQFSVRPAESPRDRCLAAQKANLEACARQNRRERAACEAGAKALISVCEAIDPKADMAAYRALFGGRTGGICAKKQCPNGCPSPDGGTCLGDICASEGRLCDPGVLWNDYCITSVEGGPPISNTKFCHCHCQ
jgi:hypothetical protein